MKGILLAAGRGTRLYPITRAVSKHLLPIYDKPMFYYPLCTLMQAGIQEILLITNPSDSMLYAAHLGDGSELGISIRYAEQPFALGIADALRIAHRYDGGRFLRGERITLILGDNLFVGDGMPSLLHAAAEKTDGVIFARPVDRPSDFGVVELDASGAIQSLVEKPAQPRSSFAVPGLYFYPPDAAELAESLTPSERGELEITALNNALLAQGRLVALPMSESVHWLDTGTYSGLLQAVNLIATLQRENGNQIGCIEETAVRMGFIPKEALSLLARRLAGTDYGDYLLRLAQAREVG